MAGPIAFVIITIAALLAITAYSYFSNRRDALALSADVLAAIERRIAGELEAFLAPIEDTVRLTTTFLENAGFNIDNRDLLETLAFNVLANLSQVTNFIVADTGGNFLMVARQVDGSLHTKIIDRSAAAPQVTWIRRDPEGTVVDEQTSVDDSYDPRNRPWYIGAVENGVLHWTDFYIFFASQTHGTTISLPIMGQNDERLGVFGLDIELKEISAFLDTLRIGKSGEAIIIDEEGYIVAHPEIKKMVKKEGDVFKPILVEELGNPILNRAYSRFLIEGHGHRDLVVDDRRYLSTAFLMPQKTGLDLSVFVFVPENDFVGFVARNNRNILLLSAVVVVLAAIMAGLLVYQSLRAEHSTQKVLAHQDELEAQARAFSELSSKAAVFGADDEESYRQLTEIVTDAISLRRTSLWHFDDKGRLLTCIDSYDRESNGHTRGTVLTRREFPELFDLLLNGEDIRTGDAEADGRLAELFRVYLQPLGCTSLAASPIRYQDVTEGALWFEQEPLQRGWSDEEISFMHTIANMLALRFSVSRQSLSQEPVRLDGTAGGQEPESVSAQINDEDDPTETPLYSLESRMAAAGVFPDQSAADIHEETTVLALQFTDPVSLGLCVDDSKSTSMVDQMIAYLEKETSSLGIDHMAIMGEEIICAAGIKPGSENHARRIADLALRLQNQCSGLFTSLNTTMKFCIGIDTGAVMGSATGLEAKTYNLWGEATRFASKMAESGVPGGIQVSQATYRRLRAAYLFKMRGRYYLPGIGEISTYLLTGRI
jgi:class 3 adenylate cyclase